MKNNWKLIIIICVIILGIGDSFGQCYGIKNSNKRIGIWFVGTRSECEAEYQSALRRIKNNQSPFHRQGERFGVSEAQERNLHGTLDNLHIEAELKSFKEHNTIERLASEECNTTQSDKETSSNTSASRPSDNINYDETKEILKSGIDIRQEQAEAIWRKVDNDPTFKKSTGKIVGTLPPKTTVKLERPKPQKYECNFGQIVTSKNLKKYAFDFIGQWLDRNPWQSYISQIPYGEYSQGIYDEAMRNGCENRAEDYTLFCERLRRIVVQLADTLQKRCCIFNPELDMPLLSNNVYDNCKSAPSGWTRLENFAGSHGFFAALYQNLYDSTVFVLAFRGSEKSISDWNEDILQGLIGASFQYNQSKKIINSVVAELSKKLDAKLYLTGHSLGGGLASYAHISAKDTSKIVATYTYNAAGLHSSRVKNKNTSNVYAYHTIDDPLTLGQIQFNRQYIDVFFVIKPLEQLKKINEILRAKQNLRHGRLNIIGEERVIPAYIGHSIVEIEKYYDEYHGWKIGEYQIGVNEVRNNAPSLLRHVNESFCQYKF